MRKLATAALSCALAIFISQYILPYEFLLYAGVFVLLLSLLGLFFRDNTRLRIFILLISMATGFVWSYAYTQIYVMPHWNLGEEPVKITVIATDYPVARQPRGYYVDVKIIKDKKDVGARLYYYDEVNIIPGDIVEATARLRRADVTSDGEQYNTLTSKGIFLSGSVIGDISKNGSSDSIKYLPKRLTQKIAEIIDEIYQENTAQFMKALLVGRREDLNNNQAASAALSASGIIHVVAVSGMHISFLMGFISQIIKNNKLFAIYGIPILLLFMAMTGFTPSVTRAGIMQIFLICAPLFKRESDSITSLMAAILLILLLNPYACTSVGLQMSFAATLGIITFTPRINATVTDFIHGKKMTDNKYIRTVINYVTSGLSATIGALIFTLPLSVIHFGYFSLVSPITNILVMPAVSLAFPLGLITAIIGLLHQGLAEILVYPGTWAVEYILFTARFMASVPYSIIYSSDAHIMFWLAYVYVMFIILPALKIRARQYLYPVCISLIMLFTIIPLSLLLYDNSNVYITAVDVGQGSSTVIGIENSTIVIDCGSLSTKNAGRITHEYLQRNSITSIDILALTHFHDDHVNGVEFLLSTIKVSTLVVPDPEGSFLAEDIIELARKCQTDIIYANQALTFDVGQSQLFVYPPLGAGDENEKGLSYLVVGELTALITGDMNATIERALLRYANIPALDVLIVGHHGSRESSSEELLSALTPQAAIISVGKNSFGHPHSDTLARLERFNAAVYRTDQSGHVTISGTSKN